MTFPIAVFTKYYAMCIFPSLIYDNKTCYCDTAMQTPYYDEVTFALTTAILKNGGCER